MPASKTSSRDEILTRVRRQAVPGGELPHLRQCGQTFPDPPARFAEVLTSVGGRCVRVPDAAAAHRDLEQIEQYATAAKTCSLVPGVGRTSFDLAAVDDPHELQDIDFAVLPGELAVAENAAVWVTDANIPHRVLFFLPQHLALAVPSERIVHNMHAAYARIQVGSTPFGTFISGPSKTADIEQALVIGAHGARSLTVYLIDQM